MGIDPNSGDVIDLDEAKEFVANFRSKFPDQPKGFFAGCDKLALLLEQDDCIGIRIYNGYDDKKGSTNLVLVGVDKDEKDITNGVILERLVPCPQSCDTTSALN